MFSIFLSPDKSLQRYVNHKVLGHGRHPAVSQGLKKMKTAHRIRSASREDAETIARIYNYYVENTIITFEEEPVSLQAMALRIADVQGLSLPWLVAEVEAKVVGYAYATKWKVRSAYRYAVETTVYLEQGLQGRGIGSALYAALLPLLRAQGMHVAIGGAALPNDASVALHEKLGFEPVGVFRQVGFKHGRWVDVAYWQLVL
jgi:L-amino acid N-acyltransferase YncA